MTSWRRATDSEIGPATGQSTAASMLKRYPITADTAQPHKSQRSGTTPTRTLSEQLTRSGQQVSQGKQRGPCL
ncbi:hypothetical protein D7Y26_09520 [Stenotrophomonas maltophilia]|nr:hypothetical protein [Stenotrophomonas maltophilia]MBA0323857.1 hypothetical protein [Stenotrophomonas maltophilia]